MIEEYLLETNKDYILREQKETENLIDDSRQKLIAALCDFMRKFFRDHSNHSVKIKKHHKVMTATAALEIFPQLEGGDGRVVRCVKRKTFLNIDTNFFYGFLR